MGHRVRILHVSDLHERVALEKMGDDRRRKIRVMAPARRRVLEESNFFQLVGQLRDGGGIDLVCFTGDVADWGLEAEYGAATRRLLELLGVAGVPRERLFVVPGNHDIDRSRAPDAWAGLREFAAAQPAAVSRWMAGLEAPPGADPAWRDAILGRKASFWQWVEHGLGRPELLPSRHAHQRLGYRATVRLERLPFPVHVIGLDTAWLAGAPQEAGTLRLTEEQIDLLARDDDAKPLDGFRLALMHHPLGHLADERPAIGRLAATVDLVLHGHQHDPVSEVRSDPDRALHVLAAGCLYEGDEGDRWPNAFHAIDADLDAQGRPLRYDVRFWAWSERGHWHKSGALYAAAPDGQLTIQVAPAGSGATQDLPEPVWYVVPRPQSYGAVKNKLLAGAQGVHALVGMPCAGKSTLAAELARDADLAQAFPGGVFWVTLGHEAESPLPSIRALLRLCGDAGLAIDDVAAGAERLAKALRGRKLLIIVDDAWREADARPFVHPGPSRVLLTTRDLAVAQAFEAAVHDIGPLTPDEAISLVERRLDRPLDGDERAAAARVADAVGRLPLSIAAACARIEAGGSWAALLGELADEATRLDALEAPADGAGAAAARSVAAAFAVSLRALPDEDVQAFALLGLLAEDVAFGSAVAARLWSVAAADAEKRLRLLRRKALVLPDHSPGEGQAYRLHDEQRNAARRQLGLSPIDGHRRLLDRYAQIEPRIGRIADDGYLHSHLAWHLVAAGRAEALHRLLADEDGDANVWWRARRHDPAAYLDDLDRAVAASPGAPGLEVRYAVMRSAVASLGSNVPAALLRELVRRGLWSADRAWGHALSLPPVDRTRTLAALTTLLPQPQRGRCLGAFLDDLAAAPLAGRAHMLLGLPFGLTPDEGDRVFDSARRSGEGRAYAVVVVLRHFAAADRLDELFAELRSLAAEPDLGSENGVPWTLLRLLVHVGLVWRLSAAGVERFLAFFPDDAEARAIGAQRLASLGGFDRALALIEGLPDGWRGQTIARTARLLRDDQLPALESAAKAIADAYSQNEALAAVYARQGGPIAVQWITERWKTAPRDLRAPLIAFIPAEVACKARLPDGDSARLRMVRRLVELGLAERALELIGPPRRERSFELEEIAAALDEPALVRLGVTATAADPWVLAALLPRWVELGHGAEIGPQLQRIAGHDYPYSHFITRIADTLDDGALESALAAGQRIGDDDQRLRCMARLAAAAPDALGPELLQLPLERIFGHAAVHALARELPTTAAAALRLAIASPLYRLAISCLHPGPGAAALMDDLPDAAAHLRGALDKAKALPLAEWGALYRDLRAAMPYFIRALDVCPPAERALVEALGTQVLAHFGLDEPAAALALFPLASVVAAAAKQTSVSRLAHLAALLGGRERGQVEAQVTALLPKDEPWAILDALVDAKALSPALLDLAFAQLKRLDGDLGLNGAALVEHLARAGRIADALEVMSRIPSAYDNSRLLASVALAGHAPRDEAQPYIERAWSQVFRLGHVDRNWNDAEALGRLIPAALALPRVVVEALWRRALPVLARQKRGDLFDLVAALAPMIAALGGREAMVTSYHAAADAARWWP